jgi:hypothetical protein
MAHYFRVACVLSREKRSETDDLAPRMVVLLLVLVVWWCFCAML